MSIKRRIWALPVISTIIFSLGLAGSGYLVTQALDSINTTESVDYPVLDMAKTITLDVGTLAGGLRDTVTEGDKERIAQIAVQAAALRAKMEQFAAIPGQREHGARLAQEFDAYFSPAFKVARIMLALETGDPQVQVTTMQAALATLNADLAKTHEAALQQFKDGVARSKARVQNVLSTSVAVALVVIASLVLVAHFVVKAIWRQLGGEPEYARQIARAVADGDLSMEIATHPDDRGSLLFALQHMRATLGGMIADIKLSAETIKVASSEIALGNADLASRTESQAGSLDQTARSMESLTDTVRQNADNATQANQLVVSASSVATKGGQVVDQVVLTMSEINDSSRRIVDIIGVIDGIAFQTNILALNAAVEAARAGEQGRGFAVVASEVRNLAQRSAGAAKEIKQLIGDSVAKVGIGSRLVDEAGLTMGQIVESVRKVADIMAEISDASAVQSAGIRHIGDAIGSMDQMTQQNSALVEQASAAAESLHEQSDQLTVALAVFKLRQTPAALAHGQQRAESLRLAWN